MILRKTLGPKGEETKIRMEKCSMRNFSICTLNKMLLLQPNNEG
jgi:hypothetical protein